MTPLTLLVIVLFFLISVWLAYKLGSYKKHAEWQSGLVRLRQDIANKQRVGIKGKLAETFAPFLRGFPFKPSECKFIGDPIDYLVFEGLDERDIKRIHLLEVKEGASKLSKHQRQIKDIIDNLNSDEVTFREFRFDSEEDLPK